jgi:arylsulfatase A-like enzyme
LVRAGYHTASISSFPLRHGAHWWTAGFLESMNLVRGFGLERADQVLPGALDWLDRRGAADEWFLHVHLWDPHTPYNTPDDYGNPFADDPIPAWYTEEVRARHWELAGPHSAQEPWGFRPDEWGTPPARQPWNLSDLTQVKAMFDGYDTGVRYADAHVGILLDALAAHGVLDDTTVMISSDHGEAFGELGVYADHQAADEATAHIPMILRGPGIPARVDHGLHYHLDVAATVADHAGAQLPPSGWWDGVSFRDALRAGHDAGRDFLVTSQGAWSCQRGVRFDDHLWLRTYHDGYHEWPEEMLFDVVRDPHEQRDLTRAEPAVAAHAAGLLEDWYAAQVEDTPGFVDPLAAVIADGGPYHLRGHLPEYLERLRATGRAAAADALAARHRADDGRPT